ncbi:uncharacterized protein LOC110030062 [Phalaenopsis equestris]|uniref:uncharacterized protein LOC110030062 n=1 Tax=Phalaenopsis equestris TaxID=78828 RepID=UPI0009E335AF|nr:uncharacterized protein LOC110030062 [Phalaenopsis equestris]
MEGPLNDVINFLTDGKGTLKIKQRERASEFEIAYYEAQAQHYRGEPGVTFSECSRYTQSFAGIGGVLRNSNGKCLLHYQTPVFATDALEAEVPSTGFSLRRDTSLPYTSVSPKPSPWRPSSGDSVAIRVSWEDNDQIAAYRDPKTLEEGCKVNSRLYPALNPLPDRRVSNTKSPATMATAFSLMDTDTPFSDCSVTFLLPRTFGSSFSAGTETFESDHLDYLDSLFNSTALKNSSQLLEHAKMIIDSNCASIPNASCEDRNNILAKRSHEDQIELQGKRTRQRRPGLPGFERGDHVFNFSAKATTVEVSQMGQSNDFSKRSCVEDSQSWPVIDYSCLEHISDPVEYFSTYRMLEDAEKEVMKLKGEASPKLGQHQGRGDRRRRPGYTDHEGKRYVFKFPAMSVAAGNFQMENSTQSNGASITELTLASGSKEIRQIKNVPTIEPESRLAGNAGTCDSNDDKEIDELERLFSKHKELNNDDIEKFLWETLQINPVNVEKSRGLPFPVAIENKFESPQIGQISPVANRNKVHGLPNLKGRLSLIIQQVDPFFPHKSDRDEQNDGSAELGSNSKFFYGAGLGNLPSSESGMQKLDLEKPKSDCNDISVKGIPELEQETLKTKLLDSEMTNPVDHLSALKNSFPLIDIQGRLAKISTLKRHILQNATEGELLMLSRDDLEDFSLSKNQEMHSCSQVDVIHLNGDSMVAQNACIPGLSNLKSLNFEDKMHSPVSETFKKEVHIGRRKITDPIGCQFTLLEDTCQRPNGNISDEAFVSVVSGASFEEAAQPSALVDRRPSVTTDASDQILHAEALKDVSLPENSALIDEQLEVPGEILNERKKSQGHSEAAGGSSSRELERKEPARRQKKQKSILRRKSLAGAGSDWQSGVRRSTRIRMRPLQHWCGERFLYGRIHDSLATVIGVKKYETPLQKGGKAIMKVKSYVSEDYADLVAQAALY